MALIQVEYMLVHLDREQKKARLLLKSQPILKTLMEEEAANPKFVCCIVKRLLIVVSHMLCCTELSVSNCEGWMP